MEVLYCPISVLPLYFTAVVSPELFNEPELSMQLSCYKLSAITYLLAKFYNHLFPLTSKKFIKWDHHTSLLLHYSLRHWNTDSTPPWCRFAGRSPMCWLAVAPRYAFLFSFCMPVQAIGGIGGTYTHKCPKIEGKSRLFWKCGLLWWVKKKVSFKEEKVSILLPLLLTRGT